MKHTVVKKQTDRKEVISLSNEQDIQYWAKRLGISDDELKRAVVDAGTDVKQVKILLESRQLN
jgi:hypothetical protein